MLFAPRAKFTAHAIRGCAAALLAVGFLAVPVAGVHAQAQPAPADDALAKRIVEKADLVRFPAEGFEVGVSIATTSASGNNDVRKYRVLTKGNENTIVLTTEPASERGQILLMKGRDLWLFLPSVSQPVRLPLAQRLTGVVANGDLARANFAGDYTPKLLRSEKVDGEPAYVLELTAVDRGVTYNRVVYWVREANSRPIKAEFYSVSDRLLKTTHYENFQRMGGASRPTRIVMRDALREGEESVLDYSDMKLRDLPDKVFTKDYLKRLE